jgi:hypothetical protein
VRAVSSAAATFEQAREQPFPALPLVAPSRRIPLLEDLDLFPEVIFNDAKFRDFLRRPLVLGIGTSDALSCFRIFQKSLAIVEDSPKV